MFLADAVAAGRLRLLGSYGSGDQLYAVIKTEPAALGEVKDR